MRTKRARDWDRLIKKYDPTGIYKRRFDEIQATSTTPKAAATVPTRKASTTAAPKVKVTPKVKAPSPPKDPEEWMQD